MDNLPENITNPDKSILKVKRRSVKEILGEFKPILLFMPLILLISSDDSTLIINQMLFLADFNLGAKFSYMGALAGASQIIRAFTTLSFGYLSDKYTRKRLLLICGFGWAISDFIVAISPSFVLVFIWRLFASGFAGAASSVVLSLLSDMFSSENRGNSFAVWTFITTIGVGIGTGLASAFNVIDYVYPVDALTWEAKIAFLQATYPVEIGYWRYPFYLFGGLGFLFSFMAMFLKEPKRAAKEQILSSVLQKEDVDYSKFYNIKPSDLKYIFTRKTNTWLIMNFLDTFLSGLILTNIFSWFVGEMGFNLTVAANFGYLALILIPVLGGTVVGMFFWPGKGDKAVQNGNITGRVKMAVTAGWSHLPFLFIGFLFIPNATRMTLFRDAVQATPAVFAIGCLVMGTLVGIGMSLMMAIGPLHYASMIDVNLPEHRATMISAAAFIDAFGRALGSWVGLTIVQYYESIGSSFAMSDAILFSVCTFAAGSALMWLPIYKYSKIDFPEVARIMQERKVELERIANNSTPTNK
jgi:MFS family permease